MRSLVLTLLLLCSIFKLGIAQSYHEKLADVANEHQLIGMSVVVVCSGEVVDVFHHGKANIVNDLPITDSTVYRIASISKSVTATVLMKLYEDGNFALDDDINDHLGYSVRNPNFPDQKISFRMLLSHTSSLQDGTGYSPFLAETYAQNPVPSIKELLLPSGSAYTANMWRLETPGSFFTYSNINFGLIATLVEKISGQRFDQYAKSVLLEPLGITGSFYVNDLPNINNVATLYRNSIPQSDNYNGSYPAPFDESQYTIGDNGIRSSPHGGLRVTPLELSNFLRMHANHGAFNGTQILDSATVALMHEAQWTKNGNNGDNYYNLFNEWGLGLHSVRNTPNGDLIFPGTKMLGHPGEAYGLISDLYFEKEKQFGFIFITNGYAGSESYSFGSNSAYYQPEEKIFALIKSFQFDACETITTATKSPTEINETYAASIFYSNGTQQLHFHEDFKRGEIYSTAGQLIHQFSAKGSTETLEDLPLGVYCVLLRTESGMVAQKIVVVY
ncbi:MAG: serine hydrolase [Saprospiraceae bacterium]